MNHNAPHSMDEMRPQTIVKAGIGWTGSAVTLSSLLTSLTTSTVRGWYRGGLAQLLAELTVYTWMERGA